MKMIGWAMAVVLAVALAMPGHAEAVGPNGSHYNLSLLGKTTCSKNDLTGSNRHTIQVLLFFSDVDGGILASQINKKNKIFLTPGTTFKVWDGNACDSNGALFEMPSNVATAWEVWLKELGKPGGTGDIVLCATDINDPTTPTDDEIVCSTQNLLLARDTGKPSYRNVTQELLTFCIDTDGTGNTCDTRLNVFDNALQDWFWDFDNNGLRNVQLRFYPVQ